MRSNRSSISFYSTTALFLLLLLSLYLPELPARIQPDSTVGVIGFNSNAINITTISMLYSYLRESAGKNRLFKIPQRGSSLWYQYETRDTISPGNLARYDLLCAQIQCRYLLVGMVYPQRGSLLIKARIYSSPEKRFLCTLDQSIDGGDLKKAAGQLTRKVVLFLDGKLPEISGLTISKGALKDSVSLRWTCNVFGGSFAIFRSTFLNGPYHKVGETAAARFTDITAEEGIKYWYRITVSKGDIQGISATGYGYRMPPIPKGINLSELLAGHTRQWPVPANEKERVKEEKNIQLYKKYYESYVMVTFIIMVGRIYINSGELIAFRDFKFLSFDQPNRIVYFSKPGMQPVKFFSRRFFRFFRDVQLMELDFLEILKRLIDNAVMFCIRSGDKETREPDGRVRYVPTFEVVGMMTEYHRDYENWKSNVIVFATSDDKIYRRILEAQRKGY